MNLTIARFLGRNRKRLIDAVAGPLSPALGRDRALSESSTFVDGLAAAFLHSDTLGVLDRLRVRFSEWQRAGVDSEALLAVLLGIIRSPMRSKYRPVGAPPGEKPPSQELPSPSMMIATATANEMFEREKRQKEKFAALLTVSHAVMGTLDLNTVLTTIAKQVRQVIQTDECTVFLYDELEQVLKPRGVRRHRLRGRTHGRPPAAGPGHHRHRRADRPRRDRERLRGRSARDARARAPRPNRRRCCACRCTRATAWSAC